MTLNRIHICQVPLSYIKGFSEEQLITLRVGIYFNPRNTHQQLLVALKDPAKKEKYGVVYLINCEGEKKGEECKSSHIGETGRTLNIKAEDSFLRDCR